MPLPTLTPEQRSEALAKAAAARTARKQLLDEVKAGKLSLADVLGRADSDELVKKTKILAIVKALPGGHPVTGLPHRVADLRVHCDAHLLLWHLGDKGDRFPVDLRAVVEVA